MPTILISVPEDAHSRLQHSLFWRTDMRRTLCVPGDVFSIARTVSPDMILVSAAEDTGPVRELLGQLRREPVTHDSIVIVLSDDEAARPGLESAGASLVLPWSFSDAGEESPWHKRLEELLNLRERGETRVLADFPVHLVLTPAGGGLSYDAKAMCLNVSSRGMLLETAEVFPRGSRVVLTFQLTVPGNPLPEVAIVGEVVRTAEAGERKFAGVHFTVVRKDARLAIRDFLRARRPASATDDQPEAG